MTTDDRQHKLRVAAMSGEDAVKAVLDVIPEGWTVALLSRAKPDEVAALALQRGEVRDHKNLIASHRRKLRAQEPACDSDSGNDTNSTLPDGL